MEQTPIKTSIVSTKLSTIEKMIASIKKQVGDNDVELSFEYIIGSLFPTAWKNIQDDLSRQYTLGYIQARSTMVSERTDKEDSDCYCE